MALKIVFATNNSHKIKEVRQILPADIIILSLNDIGCDDELPETGNTFQANAQQKARYIFEKFGMDCFADDSGLEVDALGGRPGVFSARYAGSKATSDDNLQRILYEMKGIENRKANFRSVICLYLKGEVYFFDGEITGRLVDEKYGEGGFGYDPIFIPDGEYRTFSQMSDAEKNAISHRRKAVDKLVQFLWNH